MINQPLPRRVSVERLTHAELVIRAAIAEVKALGCSEKTVRNRRDRAFRALRAALDEDSGE